MADADTGGEALREHQSVAASEAVHACVDGERAATVVAVGEDGQRVGTADDEVATLKHGAVREAHFVLRELLLGGDACPRLAGLDGHEALIGQASHDLAGGDEAVRFRDFLPRLGGEHRRGCTEQLVMGEGGKATGVEVRHGRAP